MSKKRMSPPINDDAYEKKLVSLAFKQAEQQLSEGTATSQVLSHFLKLGSQRAEAELKKLELEALLIEERIASERSAQQLGEMVNEVLLALKSYTYAPPDN